MKPDELWQLFDHKAEPILNKGIERKKALATNSNSVGASHVWIWKRERGIVSVLLQRRAKSKATWPNLLDISAAGHIDLGETPIQAAVREAKEEVNFSIDLDKLMYIFSYRNFTHTNGFKWVYLYQHEGEDDFELLDGEVQSIEWVQINKFLKIIEKPSQNQLVPHPPEYYGLLRNALTVISH